MEDRKDIYWRTGRIYWRTDSIYWRIVLISEKDNKHELNRRIDMKDKKDAEDRC